MYALKRISGFRSIFRRFGIDGTLKDSELASLVQSRDRKKIARETFKLKSDLRRKEREEKVMAMPFDQLTREMKLGDSNYKDIEVDRIVREKNQLENQLKQAEKLKKKGNESIENAKIRISELESKTSKLIQNYSPENVVFPWAFSSTSEIRSPKPEGNLKTVIPMTHLLTHDLMTDYFKSFIRYLVKRNWDSLENYVEPLFIKSLKKEIGLLPSQYRIEASNLDSCQVYFDLYEARNLFISNVEVNRKKADSMHHFFSSQTTMEGAPLYLINKKRPSPDDQCGIVIQFFFNVYTDLDLKVVDASGKPVIADNNIVKLTGDKSTLDDAISQSRPHNMILEILACQDSFKSMRSEDFKVSQPSGMADDKAVNKIMPQNFKIIDIDRFMDGNPLLVGLELARLQELDQ